jgi:multidrug efflux pump subunit AcrA (membrane-fusion protein)
MIKAALLPALSVLGVVFACWTVVRSHRPVPVAAPAAAPALSSFSDFVAGAGLIEPSSELIAIGAPVGGIVSAVAVKAGAEVKADELLFQLDDRSLRAQLAVQESSTALARASLATASAMLGDARDQLARFEAVSDQRAVSLDDLQHRRNAALVAGARRDEAAAAIALAEAQAQVTRTEIARYRVCAPRAATVLQVKVRAGEFATAGVLETPLVTLGDTSVLHVRVDIDENDAWRVGPAAPAEAYVRGNRALHAVLRFVRFEPYVVPKRSLTGDSTERVDTRVLQVLYAFDRALLPVYVGQQMEVFISAPLPAAAPAPAPVVLAAPAAAVPPAAAGQR